MLLFCVEYLMLHKFLFIHFVQSSFIWLYIIEGNKQTGGGGGKEISTTLFLI